MRFTFCIVLAVCGAACLTGCGSSGESADYPSAVDFDARPDVIADAGAGDAPLPPPVTAPGSVRVVGGSLHLLQKGAPCSGDVASPTDVWCAFVAPSPLAPATNTLYVINISAASAGAAITCGGPNVDPNCLSLTPAFAEDTTHPALFQGNTLVYYDGTLTPYGWRPGMLNGRALALVTATSGDIHDCMPGRTGDSIGCLQDVPAPPTPAGGAGGAAGTAGAGGVAQAAGGSGGGGGVAGASGAAGAGGAAVVTPSTSIYSDLLVGHVGPASPVLPRVTTVISGDTSDAVQRFKWRIVGTAGDRIAWSTRAVPGGPEILNVQTIGDDTTRLVVATNVSQWTVSADASRWAWLSAYNYDTSNPSGTLQLQGFAAGAAPATVMTNVASFAFTVGMGMYALSDSGTLFGIVDPVNAPMVTVAVDQGVVGVVTQSRQGHLAYLKNYDFVFRLIDLYVKKFDGTGTSCTLDRSMEVPFGNSLAPRFLPGGGAVAWARVSNLDSTDPRLMAAGRLTDLATCASVTVDPDIVAMGTFGDGALILTDAFDGNSGTLVVQGLVGGNALAPGANTVVQTRMNSSLSLYPFLNVLVYTVGVGDPSDGLYVYPIPPA